MPRKDSARAPAAHWPKEPSAPAPPATRRLITLNVSALLRPADDGGALEPASLRLSLTDEREERLGDTVTTWRITDRHPLLAPDAHPLLAPPN
jgi:hypothetical protein